MSINGIDEIACYHFAIICSLCLQSDGLQSEKSNMCDDVTALLVHIVKQWGRIDHIWRKYNVLPGKIRTVNTCCYNVLSSVGIEPTFET